MIADDQRAAITLLADPATHRIAGPVEAIETHISRIFLAGDRAYKMKRAVKLPYVDFSTPELRLAACRKEVELNSETAPGTLSRRPAHHREPGGKLAFDGIGELVDAVVEMKRFDQSALLDRMAVAGALTPALMTRDRAHDRALPPRRSGDPCRWWRGERGRRSRYQQGGLRDQPCVPRE